MQKKSVSLRTFSVRFSRMMALTFSLTMALFVLIASVFLFLKFQNRAVHHGHEIMKVSLEQMLETGDEYALNLQLSSIVTKGSSFEGVWIYDTRNKKVLKSSFSSGTSKEILSLNEGFSVNDMAFPGTVLKVTKFLLDTKAKDGRYAVWFAKSFPAVNIFYLALFSILTGAISYCLFRSPLQSFTDGICNPVRKLSEVIANYWQTEVVDLEFSSGITEIDAAVQSFFREAEGKKAAEAQSKKLEGYEAIANTAQMLAHDLRKPFTMTKLILENLKMSGYADDKDFDCAESAFRKFETMIEKFIQPNSTKTLQFTDLNVRDLIERSLSESVKLCDKSGVMFSYMFESSSSVRADHDAISRLFSNIIGNAMQAVEQDGKVWFRTKHVNIDSGRMVEICVGNSGSFVEQGDLHKVFEKFYTKNKRGGTGIGLAFAQGTVTDHGGTIRCESHPGKESEPPIVEFYFTLPVGSDTELTDVVRLPEGSDEILSKHRLKRKSKTGFFTPAVEPYNHSDVDVSFWTNYKETLGRQIRVLMFDDEAIHVRNIHRFFNDSDFARRTFKFSAETDPTQMLSAMKQCDFDLLILDINFGRDTFDGFSIAEEAKKLGKKGAVCIYSDQVNSENQTCSHLVLTKPAREADFFDAMSAVLKSSDAYKEICSVFGDRMDSNSRPICVIIEDEEMFRRKCEEKMTDAKVFGYREPADFYEYASENPEFLKSVDTIIVDFYFEKIKQTIIDTGFVRAIRNLGFAGPIILATCAPVRPRQTALFDGLIDNKEFTTLKNLKDQNLRPSLKLLKALPPD